MTDRHELDTNRPGNPILSAMDKMVERAGALLDARPEKVTTITITPNYSAIFERFRVDAMNFLNRFAGSNHKSFTRKEVYDFVASMRIALCSATNVEEIVRLREGFDEGAERMFAVLMKEQEEADDADQR